MLHSMTAFSRVNQTYDWGHLIWEMRAVNHRYLEFSIRLPENFRHLEGQVREKISQQVKRGKIECQLKYTSSTANAQLNINTKLVEQLARTAQELQNAGHTLAPVDPLNLLAWPGVLQANEENFELYSSCALTLLDQVLNELIQVRLREGKALAGFLEQHVEQMQAQIQMVEQKIPYVLNHHRDKLLNRIKEFSNSVNQERLEQEWLLFAQKIDVTEELERLQTHLQEVKRIINNGGSVGRQLDFLMQELNREANTMNAKSVDLEVTHAGVNLKLLIEQMREQVQNIE